MPPNGRHGVSATDGRNKINKIKIIKMNYFNDIITDNEFFAGLPDCISEAADYSEEIQKSCEITNGILVFESFNGSKVGNKYKLDLIINGTSFDFEVDIVSDYIDGNGLVNGMNGILTKTGYKGEKRFCDASGGALDFGIAFISPEKEQELAVNGLIWRSDE
jgi:hypothetical protein